MINLTFEFKPEYIYIDQAFLKGLFSIHYPGKFKIENQFKKDIPLYFFSNNNGKFSIEFNPEEIEYVIWPNREGEIFFSEDLKKMEFLKYVEGNENGKIVIIYPSIASTRLIIIKLKKHL